VFVLTVTYAGGRTRQFSVRRERVVEIRRWLDNYQKLKETIEAICALLTFEVRAAANRTTTQALVPFLKYSARAHSNTARCRFPGELGNDGRRHRRLGKEALSR
jgi:hypothetical protein